MKPTALYVSAILSLNLAASAVRAQSETGLEPGAKEKPDTKSSLAKHIDEYLNRPTSPLNLAKRARALAERFETAVEEEDEVRAGEIVAELKKLNLRSLLGSQFYQHESVLDKRLATLRESVLMKKKGIPLLEQAKTLCGTLDTPIEALLELEAAFDELGRVLGRDVKEFNTAKSHLNTWIQIRNGLSAGNKASVLEYVRRLRGDPTFTRLVTTQQVNELLVAANSIKNPVDELLGSLKTVEDLPVVLSKLEVQSDRSARLYITGLKKLHEIHTSLTLNQLTDASSELATFQQTPANPSIGKIFQDLQAATFRAILAKQGYSPDDGEETMAFVQRILTKIVAGEDGIEKALRVLKDLQPAYGSYRGIRPWISSELRLIEKIASAERTEEAGDFLQAIYRYREALDGKNTSRIGLIEFAGARLKKLVKAQPDLAKATESLIFAQLEEIRAQLELVKRTNRTSR